MRNRVTTFFVVIASLVLGLPLASAQALPEKMAASPSLILVVGAPGQDEYTEQFSAWAARWRSAAEKAGVVVTGIGPGALRAGETARGNASDRDHLIASLKAQPTEGAELWLVFIGHGTFDGKTARFNLAGPDFTPAELGEWLKPFQRPLAIVNCASASGPFVSTLSAPGRVVISATRSGNEQNFARFGEHLSKALVEPEADLDKDGQTSLFESWLTASRATAEFYRSEGRLATEHPLLDDNGDLQGTSPDWFQGLRAIKKPKSGLVDGTRAHQFHLLPSAQERKLPAAVRERRNALELELVGLREQKGTFASEDEYYAQLEKLLVELAELYDQAGK